MPGALEAWKAGDRAGLHAALGLKPWMLSPLDTSCPYPPGSGAAASWPHIVELRRQLIEQAGSPGRVGRHGEPLGLRRGRMSP
jgi:hypothetical protein